MPQITKPDPVRLFLREALAAADVPAGALEQLVSLARASRRAAGYFDDAGGLPPNVPNPIPGVP